MYVYVYMHMYIIYILHVYKCVNNSLDMNNMHHNSERKMLLWFSKLITDFGDYDIGLISLSTVGNKYMTVQKP